MEKSLKKLISDDSEVPSAKTSGTERNAWKIHLGTAAHHASTDASLFSSSLPVLPHAKLNFAESENYSHSTDDSSPSLNRLHLEDEIKDPLEVEPSPDGCFLPGDEDELLAGLMDDFDLSGLPTQLEDLEDDFFGSGGGLELESDTLDNSLNGFAKLSMSDGILGSIVGHHVFPNSAGTVMGEHPYGEHPSRTLFVRNINSNVEDSELRSLFEQYGDIRTLYTSCKHRGFVMISYYDIRAARTAMRMLQHKPLRRRKLDIHFSIPKENPSEKDINQGTLVIFNLDPSVSNEDLLQIFGDYGEVKEIRETPHKRHHKFIEFYDVRAAEAALKALNRSDIAGKRIKLEPSRPGGARRRYVLSLLLMEPFDELY
uniref:Putative ovule protein n=1 Tax=Solanum chacoense TaxID=4108 RepID=A0A0V0IW26_SOLCH